MNISKWTEGAIKKPEKDFDPKQKAFFQQLDEPIIELILTEYLNTKPNLQDYKNTTKIFEMGNTNYRLFYRDIEIGTIIHRLHPFNSYLMFDVKVEFLPGANWGRTV